MQLITTDKATPRNKQAGGYVVWEGASPVDGAPIAMIATMATRNAKTGNMVQTWIIRTDIEPHAALKTGADVSVCGSCPQRQSRGGACYVITHQGPLAVYRAYKAGKYSRNIDEFKHRLQGRAIRFGAYGDPAMVPADLLTELALIAHSHTGYTHQWQARWFNAEVLNVCQASVEKPAQLDRLPSSAGYFRVKREGEALLAGEIECLADTKGLSCELCGLCDGKKGAKVAITVHGTMAKRF